MKFLIITTVPHIKSNDFYFAYSPYVREINIWGNGVSQIYIVAPLSKELISNIHLPYLHQDIVFNKVASFSLTSVLAVFRTILVLPNAFWQIFKAMQKVDHIHLRCPGNIGLLGCLVQILFPYKQKSAKYAGNWDPKSKQPLTYKLQKYILRSTFLTKNMQVLVYGEWEGSSKNIRPFFTASYHESNKIPFDFLKKQKKSVSKQHGVRFLFVGTLSEGKQPLYALQLIEQLQYLDNKVYLDVFGEGNERSKLEKYILENNLTNCITLHGNKTADEIQKAYQESSFLILPSKSEGWPKVVSEAMFWGCLPIVSPVSCVPNMLDFGKRGIILTMNLEEDVLQINLALKNSDLYQHKVELAIRWSRTYTLDYFENEINKIL